MESKEADTYSWHVIFIKDIAHQVQWNGRVYVTDCGITTAVMDTTRRADDQPEPELCEECFTGWLK